MIVDYVILFFFTVTSLWMGWVFLCHERPTLYTISIATMMAVLAAGTYWSIQEYKGFPTDKKFGQNRVLLWADIQNPTETSDGIIYLWVVDPDHEVTSIEKVLRLKYNDVPRAYSIPWTEKSAREAREAVQKIREGMGVVVEVTRNLPPKNSDKQPEYNLEIKILDPYQILRKNPEE
jgi:hypothetical protein